VGADCAATPLGTVALRMTPATYCLQNFIGLILVIPKDPGKLSFKLFETKIRRAKSS